jgi:molybdate transport system substrate-binding protein
MKRASRFPSQLCAALLLAAWLFNSGCHRGRPAEADDINPRVLYVGAAADLTPAFEELGRSFEQATGIRVVYNFGSTGMLARQIENGAPIDVFAAANIQFIEGLEQKGLIIPDTKTLYARGRITIWMTADSSLRIERVEDLARPEVERVGIANPEHAPYGVAAREALQAARVWDIVQPKCVFGENVRQTMQYAQSGNVNVSIVALSLSMQSDGRWVLIPEELHRPLDQAVAALKSTRREQQARRFIAFINSEQGRPIMRKYGFMLPGEAVVRQ